MEKILVTGANGQLGSELTSQLRDIFGDASVIATDINPTSNQDTYFEILDVLDTYGIHQLVKKYKITQIYHLAAILSAKGEENHHLAWDLNMRGLINVLEVAKEDNLHRVYWPSSIAVFGPGTPKQNTPQITIMDPITIYGISKLAGERWCAYYHEKFGMDVRSLRYPGLVSYKTKPGGGTTDFAIEIFHKAILEESFYCFLKEDTSLPMMYMPDAVDATIKLMSADPDAIKNPIKLQCLSHELHSKRSGNSHSKTLY